MELSETSKARLSGRNPDGLSIVAERLAMTRLSVKRRPQTAKNLLADNMVYVDERGDYRWTEFAESYSKLWRL